MSQQFCFLLFISQNIFTPITNNNDAISNENRNSDKGPFKYDISALGGMGASKILSCWSDRGGVH